MRSENAFESRRKIIRGGASGVGVEKALRSRGQLASLDHALQLVHVACVEFWEITQSLEDHYR